MKAFEQRTSEALERLEADLGNSLAIPTPKQVHLEILRELSLDPTPLEIRQIAALKGCGQDIAASRLVELAGLLGVYDFPVRLIRTRRGFRTYLYSLKRHTPAN